MAPAPNQPGAALLMSVLTLFVPVYGLFPPLRRFRAVERLLVARRAPDFGDARVVRPLLPALVVVFQVYLGFLAAL